MRTLAFEMRNHVCNNHHRHGPFGGAHSLYRRQSQAAGTVRPAKLAAWERSNGVGRLVKKEPPRVYPTWTAPASFTLHEGNFSSDGVILVTIMRSHSADSRLIFEVAEEPKAGQVRVLLDFGGNTELLHLAESITAAELWIAREGYRNARLEIVGAEDSDRAGRADLAA
jgi:hypothetical protein